MFDFCNQDLQVDNGDQQMNAWRDKLLFGTCYGKGNVFEFYRAWKRYFVRWTSRRLLLTHCINILLSNKISMSFLKVRSHLTGKNEWNTQQIERLMDCMWLIKISMMVLFLEINLTCGTWLRNSKFPPWWVKCKAKIKILWNNRLNRWRHRKIEGFPLKK